MTGSKSSQTTRSVVLAFLALWSIVSLIIIVVWATRPDLKISPLSSECRAELQVSEETLQRTKENMQKDRRALETMVEELRGKLEEVEGQRTLLTAVLEMTNATLQNCTATNDILRSNISVLEQHIQTHIQTERNLTAVNSDLQDTVEVLQQNVTELTLHTQACHSLRGAAESRMSAAQFQNTACNASKLLMHKQLLRCKDDVTAATAVAEKLRSSKTETETEDEDGELNGSSRLQTFSFSLMTFLCWSVTLHV